MRLVADGHAARLDAVAAREDIERQPARQRVQDLVHVGEHEVVLLHVGLAHVLRQAGAGRLLAGEVVGRLFAVAHGESGVQIEIASLLHHFDQVGDGNRGEDFARAMRLAHVAAEQSRIGLAHFGQRLASDEVLYSVLFEAGVGLAPADNR